MRWWGGLYAIMRGPVDNVWAPETNLPSPAPPHICHAVVAPSSSRPSTPTRQPAKLTLDHRQAE